MFNWIQSKKYIRLYRKVRKQENEGSRKARKTLSIFLLSRCVRMPAIPSDTEYLKEVACEN